MKVCPLCGEVCSSDLSLMTHIQSHFSDDSDLDNPLAIRADLDSLLEGMEHLREMISAQHFGNQTLLQTAQDVVAKVKKLEGEISPILMRMDTIGELLSKDGSATDVLRSQMIPRLERLEHIIEQHLSDEHGLVPPPKDWRPPA